VADVDTTRWSHRLDPTPRVAFTIVFGRDLGLPGHF